MKQKVVGLFVLLILAFTVITCSSGLDQSPSNEASPAATSSVEQFEESTTASNDIPEANADTEDGGSTISESSENQAQSDEQCILRYSFLFGPDDTGETLKLRCAVAFNVEGKVSVIQGDLSEDLKSNQDLPSGGESNPNILKEDYTLKAEEIGSGADLLFDTFDWIRVTDTFEFLSDMERGDLDTPVDFQLDLGQLLVGNVRPTGLDSRGEEISSSTNQRSSRNTTWIAQLWQWGVNRVNSIPFVSIRPDLFIQKAVASEISTSGSELTLGQTALTTKTDEVTIESNLAVYVVDRNAVKQETQVFSLTDEPVRVTDKFGQVVELRRNQKVVATERGFNGTQFEYRLCGFYRDNSVLLEGLAPNEENVVKQKPLPLQASYRTARSLTLPLYNRNCRRPCPQPGS